MQFGQLKRREFITLVGGAAATWPLPARAQQSNRVRHLLRLLTAGYGNSRQFARTDEVIE